MATPNAPIDRPAIAGPTTRAPLNRAELRATAGPTSSRPTISTENAWRTGMSTAFAIPSRTASTRIIQTWTTSVTTRTARMAASTIMIVWVTMSTRRLGRTSAYTPANNPKIITGMNCAAATMPSHTGSWVS